MQFTWEQSDIRGGVRYTKMNIREIWIIGYKYAKDSSANIYCSVSLLDGSISKEQTAFELANELTKNEYIPLEMSDKREREKLD